ncbi:MAG: hypothetical protein AAGF19_10900 [Pseudomonadota bacterium]
MTQSFSRVTPPPTPVDQAFFKGLQLSVMLSVPCWAAIVYLGMQIL